MTQYFEILIRGPRPNVSLLLPSGAKARGLAFQESATAGLAELADGTKPYAGFVTNAVVTAIPTPTYAELAAPANVAAKQLENPFLAGDDGSFEDAEEVIAGGTDYIDTSVNSGVALKTGISFDAGKFKVCAATKLAHFVLVEKVTIDSLACYRFQRLYGSSSATVGS